MYLCHLQLFSGVHLDDKSLVKLDGVNCADSAFIIFELLYNCFKKYATCFFCHFVVCSVFVYL